MRQVRCLEAPGESAKWNTVGKLYPVLEINDVLGEFLSVGDDGERTWFKMRRFDFSEEAKQ